LERTTASHPTPQYALTQEGRGHRRTHSLGDRLSIETKKAPWCRHHRKSC